MAVSVAIIGTGWAERVQIPAFQAAGLNIVMITGRNEEKTRRIAQTYNIPHYSTNWQDTLQSNAKLISVTSPPFLHKEQTLAILESGRHVLCEKPMALNIAEAREMVTAAEAASEQFALVDFELRFTPARRKAKELLAAGLIGRVVTVTARVATDFRTNPALPFTWWSDRALGGGVLGAIGSHVFDGIRWLLDDAPITLKGASLKALYDERKDADGVTRPVTADDIASVVFEVGDAVGTMLVHAVALDEPIDLLTIRGTEGTLVIDKSLKLYLGKREGPLKEYVTHLPGIVPNRFRSSAYGAGTVLLGQAIADGLEGSNRSLVSAATLRDGAEVQALLDGCRALADG